MSDCLGINKPTSVKTKKAKIKLNIGPAKTTSDLSNAGLFAKTNLFSSSLSLL